MTLRIVPCSAREGGGSFVITVYSQRKYAYMDMHAGYTDIDENRDIYE